MIIRITLKGVPQFQDHFFVERLPDNLKAYWKPIWREATWIDAAGRPAKLNGAQNLAETAKTDSSLDPILLIVSPTFIAVFGKVGVTITSTSRIASLRKDF